MTRTWKRPATIWAGVVWIGGLGILIGSVIFSTFGVAHATGNAAFVANQGAPGSSAWPVTISGTPNVSASQSGPWSVGQSGTWTLGIDPNNNTVSGTVGIDPNHNSVNVSGSVGITGTPGVTSADQTTQIYKNVSISVPPGGFYVTPDIDTSGCRTIRVTISADTLSSNVQWDILVDGNILDSGDFSIANPASTTLEVPGLLTRVKVFNGDPASPHGFQILVDCRAN